MLPAFDVFDVGRMAVLQDPTKAVISVWQPKKHQGTGIAGEEGTLIWADLITPERDQAAAFYGSLFNWKIEAVPNDPSGYLHIATADGEHIGGLPMWHESMAGAPPHWLAYFAVVDCERSTERAQQAGAKVLTKMSMENVGRWAVLADPQGAVFSIFQRSRK